jgi:cold shock protein
MQRRTGIVKFYNISKGFGFIIENETKEEFFVHSSGLMRSATIKEGDLVAFDIVKAKRSVNNAVAVEPI